MPFVVALVFALVLTPAARRVGLALGLVDRPQPDPLKIHREPVSVLGGVAFLAGAYGALWAVDGRLPWSVVGAGVLALATGHVDDARPLAPWVRSALLALAGIVLATGGFRLEALGPLGSVGTVLLVLACANAVNLLDGQDGLAGGLVAIACLGLSALAARAGTPGAAFGLAAAGALAGFLVWNMSPISVFLGNGGAYAAGTLLAALAADTSRTGDWQSFLATGVCLGVLALELILTVGRRLFSSGTLVMGDRDHSYDILSRRVGSRMAVTLGFWGLGISAAGLGVIVIRLPLPLGATLIAVLGALSLSVGSWLWAAERRAVRRSP